MKNKNDYSRWTRFAASVLHGTCRVVGLLPHRVLYGPVAGAVCFLLHRVARYRLKVVRDNLRTSFPERDAAWLDATERGFYRNLAEYFIDAIDMAGISESELLRRCTWPADNRAEVMRLVAGRNWVTLLGHYGSWELLSAYGLWPDSSAMVSAYRPLENRAFDLYYRRVRNRPPRLNSVPSNDMLRFYSAHRDGLDGRGLSMALIADQNPPLDAQSRWVPFLNHPTVFFHGGEKIARKFALPVFYMRVRKMGRGLWEQTFEPIWDGISPTSDYEITGRYAKLLEEDILRTPELWLWSHRRWKRRPTGEHKLKYEAEYGSPRNP